MESAKNEKVYLDYNATTPLDPHVADSISKSLVDNWQNPSSQYGKGKLAKSLINESRSCLADMINAKSSDVVFTSGGTESNNMVFFSCLCKYAECFKVAENTNQQIPPIPHMIISQIEHDSVKCIADHYRKENLAEITEIEVNEDGIFNVSDVISQIRQNTVLVSIMLANNETGVILPVKELGAELRALKLESMNRTCPLYLHTDAAQAIGKIPVDVDDLNVDYLTIVGHKFYGPRIGALFARTELPKACPVNSLFFGAGQENGLRPGTENTPMIIGLGKAAQLVNNNSKKFTNHMKSVRDYLEDRLVEEFGIENLSFNGRTSKSTRLPNTCNVSFIGNEKFKGHLILKETNSLEASTGACCHSDKFEASKILLAMGVDESIAGNAIRMSVGRETTRQQIETVIQDLKQALKKISLE